MKSNQTSNEHWAIDYLIHKLHCLDKLIVRGVTGVGVGIPICKFLRASFFWKIGSIIVYTFNFYSKKYWRGFTYCTQVFFIWTDFRSFLQADGRVQNDSVTIGLYGPSSCRLLQHTAQTESFRPTFGNALIFWSAMNIIFTWDIKSIYYPYNQNQIHPAA